MTAMTAKNVLLGNRLFAQLPDPSIDRIASLAVMRSYPRNTMLFYQGDVGDSFFAVISGRIRINANSLGGQEIHICEIDNTHAS
jgi:CRP-like cAMP-binding protein